MCVWAFGFRNSWFLFKIDNHTCRTELYDRFHMILGMKQYQCILRPPPNYFYVWTRKLKPICYFKICSDWQPAWWIQVHIPHRRSCRKVTALFINAYTSLQTQKKPLAMAVYNLTEKCIYRIITHSYNAVLSFKFISMWVACCQDW